jgi:hypothetical protein
MMHPDKALEQYEKTLNSAYSDLLNMLNNGCEFFWRMAGILSWSRPDQRSSSQFAPEEWKIKMEEMIRHDLVEPVMGTSPIRLQLTVKGKRVIKRGPIV